MTLRGDNIAREFTEVVDSYVARKYAARKSDATKPPRSISHQPISMGSDSIDNCNGIINGVRLD